MAEFKFEAKPISETGEIIGELTFGGKLKPLTHEQFLLQAAEDRVFSRARQSDEITVAGGFKPRLAPDTEITQGLNGVIDAIIEDTAGRRERNPKWVVKRENANTRIRAFVPTENDVIFSGMVTGGFTQQAAFAERGERQKRIISTVVKAWAISTEDAKVRPSLDEWLYASGYIFDEKYARVYKLKD